jgi:hypothetical protein
MMETGGDVAMKRWPKFDALCDICAEYSRNVELHTGGLLKDDNGNPRRNLTTLVISSGEKKLLTQRITKGDLDKAAELIQNQLGA